MTPYTSPSPATPPARLSVPTLATMAREGTKIAMLTAYDQYTAQVFDEAGFTATLASNSEFEIERYLRPGDTVSAETVVESISDETVRRMLKKHTQAVAEGGMVYSDRQPRVRLAHGGCAGSLCRRDGPRALPMRIQYTLVSVARIGRSSS